MQCAGFWGEYDISFPDLKGVVFIAYSTNGADWSASCLIKIEGWRACGLSLLKLNNQLLFLAHIGVNNIAYIACSGGGINWPTGILSNNWNAKTLSVARDNNRSYLAYASARFYSNQS